MCRLNIHIIEICRKYLKKLTYFGYTSKICTILTIFLIISCLSVYGQVQVLQGGVQQNEVQTEVHVRIPRIQPQQGQIDQTSQVIPGNVQQNQPVFKPLIPNSDQNSDQLSAIGVKYDLISRRIFYIDP